MLKIASRKSNLALLQVKEVLSLLGNPEAEILALESYGDANKNISLLEPHPDNIFTDSVDSALLEGRADCAVHSAKDLPYPLAQGLELAALTACLDATDVLVSRNNLTLMRLPENARVATSSLPRKEELLKLRPDLTIVSVRGTIEERLAFVEQNNADALVVAGCALKRLGLTHLVSEILPFAAHPLQGMLAIVVRKGDRRMYTRFAEIDVRLSWGKVWLVGGGPGDADLITRKGAHIISRAEVLLYDDLVSPDLVALCPGEKIATGKRKGRHSVTQDEINELIYRYAISGKRVVRLKGGDTLIFARSGEEIEYLQHRHIPIELVPGISSYQGAASDLLMPLTRRGVSEKFSVGTAHRAAGDETHSETRAVFMGASVKESVASSLAADKNFRLALVRNATLPYATLTLSDCRTLADSPLESPLMIICGDLVPKRLPRRILHTGLDAVEPLLEGVTVHWPLIETKALYNARLPEGDFDALILTSRVAAEIFLSRFGLPDFAILAIGSGTREMIEHYGANVNAQPQHADSDTLNDLIERENCWQNILYPCSDRSDNVLHRNPRIHPFILYNTKPVLRNAVDLSNFDAVVFSSPSTVEAFFAIYNNIPDHLIIYVHGPMTVRRLVKYGIHDYEIINIQNKLRL